MPGPASNNPYPVAPAGFLFGVCTTLVLFGLHTGQVSRYYHRFGHDDRAAYRYLIVPLVFGLSCTHVGLVVCSLYHYYVKGIGNPAVWGYFYWALSAQDLLIPTISFVSHCFFGYRVYILVSCKRLYWHAFLVFAFLTFLVGITFGILARLWAEDPWMSYSDFQNLKVGPAANSLPTVWLSCAALIDGGLTACLLIALLRQSPVYKHTRQVIANVMRLTLETVLMTHVIGATLFVLWLTSRTRTNAFWFFCEIISETYSLSILFTLNSRQGFRKAARPDSQYIIDKQLDDFNRSDDSDHPLDRLPRRKPRANETPPDTFDLSNPPQGASQTLLEALRRPPDQASVTKVAFPLLPTLTRGTSRDEGSAVPVYTGEEGKESGSHSL